MAYKVYSDYGCGTFENENDAITAFHMFGQYHNLNVDIADVKEGLKNENFFCALPIAIQKDQD